jgi:hypothetical protein
VRDSAGNIVCSRAGYMHGSCARIKIGAMESSRRLWRSSSCGLSSAAPPPLRDRRGKKEGVDVEGEELASIDHRDHMMSARRTRGAPPARLISRSRLDGERAWGRAAPRHQQGRVRDAEDDLARWPLSCYHSVDARHHQRRPDLCSPCCL